MRPESGQAVDSNRQARHSASPAAAQTRPPQPRDGRLSPFRAWFRDADSERAFQRASLPAARDYVFMLALVALVGALASGYVAWVELRADSAAFLFGTACRGLLATAAFAVVFVCRRVRKPWMLYACNATVLSIGCVTVALRSSLPEVGPATVFHVTQNGLMLLLIVATSQLALVPGWFTVNALISAAALAVFLVLMHFQPEPVAHLPDVTMVGIIGFLFILGIGIGSQQLRRQSWYARVQLQQAILQLNELATRDHLTDCANRRHFYALAESELARSRRYQRAMSLITLDVDHFKRVNDNHGHEAGDRVLAALADVIRVGLRELDTLGRIGGEEFALLLPETSRDEAEIIAERLRQAISEMSVPHDGTELGVTASFGVTERRSGDRDIDALMRRADRALYQAKAGGRNRVITASGESRVVPDG